MTPPLDLAENEFECCDRLQRGGLCLELLTLEDPEIAESARRHPALL